MTPEEFKALLDTYGAALTRWPHGRRQSAQRLLAESGVARDAFAAAQEFDDLLAVREPSLDGAARQRLTDAILDNLPEDPMPRQTRAAQPVRQTVRPTPRPNLGIGALVLRPLAPLWVGCLGMGLAVGIAIYAAQPHSVAPAQAESGLIETWAMYGH